MPASKTRNWKGAPDDGGAEIEEEAIIFPLAGFYFLENW